MRPGPGRTLLLGALALLVLLVLSRVLVGFYTDLLWYREVGYTSTFWTRFRIGLGVRSVAGGLGAAVVFLNLWLVARNLGPVRVRRRYGNIEIAEQVPRRHVTGIMLAVALLGGWWLAELQFDDSAALAVISWLRGASWGLTEPVFGHDVSFYVFSLPVRLAALDYLILVTIWTVALVALGHVLVGGIRLEDNRPVLSDPARLHLAMLVATMLVLLGVRYGLGRYTLVVDGHGVGGALGYTDVRARLPAHWIMALLSVAAAGSLLYGAIRRTLMPPVIGLGGLVVAGIVIGTAYPAIVQKFQVEPNELSREAPYIRWNLEFTRQAYGLAGVERRRFPYRRQAIPARERLTPIAERFPLWDPAPLHRAYNETQSIFTYYRFPDVDYDRYGPPGDAYQVGISVREFDPDGLEPGSRTWQSLRLNPAYVRGMGAVVAPTHRTSEAADAPQLWVLNINPVTTSPAAPASLYLEQPGVFFGETMDDYVVVVPGRDSAFTGRAGVEYPGGVPLSSFLRVLAFAWRFGDETLLFSGDITRESRMVFRRSIHRRVQELAPFLTWDPDALPVIVDGRIVWLVDGYATTASFPLARADTLGRRPIRYLRNSVKAAVDAVNGAVAFYVVDAEDPLLATYARAFPALFQPLEEMPPALRRHLRYPELALLTQAKILQQYHLERAEAFYAGQDVWQLPQEPARAGVQPYGPLYALMPVPLENTVEYLALLPFIALGRQNMTAVLLARNDAQRYGQLTLVEFPRDQQVPGPAQVQAMIEGNPLISPELSLRRQRGSVVELGRVRVLPLDSAVLYVQPIFVSAEENPIPELWRVVASDGTDVRMAPTLGTAMAGLGLPVDPPEDGDSLRPGPTQGWPRESLDLLDRAESRLREGDWAAYGQLMQQLRELLERWIREAEVGPG